MFKKLKSLLADDAIFMATLMLLVGIVSFGLGRQSMVGGSSTGPAPTAPAGVIFTDVTKTQENSEISVDSVEATSADSVEAKVVGSRSGTKFHLLSCPGAAQIKEENKVYFDSVELAKAAGYTPAANCPGLQ